MQLETPAQRAARMTKAIASMKAALHRAVDPDERHRLTQRIADHRAGLALLEVHQPKKDTQ